LIVTKGGTLWTTRLISLLILKLSGVPTRRYEDKEQKDKICMNIWLDESTLTWPSRDRNSYTAHEIAQIKPLINKNRTYERFIEANIWLKDYWPNSVKFGQYSKINEFTKLSKPRFIPRFLYVVKQIEKFSYKLQYLYMKRKITRETVSPLRAIFHPHDWGEIVLQQLTS